jgi:prephenate dehydrogenase
VGEVSDSVSDSVSGVFESVPEPKLRIGVVGFGNFGQFIAKTFAKDHDVLVTNRDDRTAEATQIGCQFFNWFDMENFLSQGLDVVVIAVSILSFESVLKNLPVHLLSGMLVVDVLSVKVQRCHCHDLHTRLLITNSASPAGSS